MRVVVSGFLAFCDSRHMTADAVGKRVNGMGHVLVNHLMAHQTLLRPGSFGLKLGRRYSQLMDVVTGGTGYPLVGMCGEFPALILLMVALAKIFRIDFLNIPITESGGFKVYPQGSTGLVSNGPFHILLFSRFAAAVTGPAYLGPKSCR